MSRTHLVSWPDSISTDHKCTLIASPLIISAPGTDFIVCRVVHQSVEHVGKEFYEYLRRRVWVTPMSYLELLGSFKRQLAAKRADVGRNRSRLQVRTRESTQCVLVMFFFYVFVFPPLRHLARGAPTTDFGMQKYKLSPIPSPVCKRHLT